MKTTIKETNDGYLVTLEGELDTASAIEVDQQLQPLFKVSGKEILMDCAHLEYIASSGLRILLGLLKSAKANDNKLVLRHLNEEITNVFKMTGFVDIFTIE